MPLSLLIGSDFSNASFVVQVPPSEDSVEPSEYIIPQLFTITDDNINEVVQSFVLVGEIGADVRERFTCFQREGGEIGCNGNMEPTARFGATRIQIYDNDGRLDFILLSVYTSEKGTYRDWKKKRRKQASIMVCMTVCACAIVYYIHEQWMSLGMWRHTCITLCNHYFYTYGTNLIPISVPKSVLHL